MQLIKIETTIPLVMIIVGLADIGSRFTRIDAPRYAVERYRLPYDAFQQNRSFASDRVYGDLAGFGNFPELRRYHKEIFSTDDLGYRNSNSVRQGNISGIVVGSSFSAGSSVNDDQTLAVVLSKLTGQTFYNAGQGLRDEELLYPVFVPNADRVVKLADGLGLRRAIVLFEVPERSPVPAYDESSWSNQQRQSVVQLAQKLGVENLYANVQGFIKASPLRNRLEAMYKEMLVALGLPNPYANRVARRKVLNEEPILFLWEELFDFEYPRDYKASAEYFRGFSNKLAKRGLKLVVVLLPSKFRVYHKMLQPGELPQYEDYPSFFDKLQSQLESTGIPVINLTQPFIDAATDAYAKGHYIFHPTDSHWNTDGISVAAEAIKSRLQELEKPGK